MEPPPEGCPVSPPPPPRATRPPGGGAGPQYAPWPGVVESPREAPKLAFLLWWWLRGVRRRTPPRGDILWGRGSGALPPPWQSRERATAPTGSHLQCLLQNPQG